QWEFSNSNFLRNQPDLLYFVTRKKGKDTENIKEPNEVDLNHILNEIASIKKHQMTISVDLKNIQRDNQILWQETVTARDRHRRQQETIDKILRFLASVFSADKKRAIVPKKRRLLLGNSDTDYGNQEMIGSLSNWALGDEGQGVANSNPSASENELNRLMNNPAALSILASLAVNDPTSTNNLPQLDLLNSLSTTSSDAIDDFLDPSNFSSLLQPQSDQVLNQTAPSSDDSSSSSTLANEKTLNSESLVSSAASASIPNNNTSSDTINAQYKVPEQRAIKNNVVPGAPSLLDQNESIFNTNGAINNIEERINALDSNVDYLTSLTAQLGYDPETNDDLELENGTGDDFLSYYDANFNPTEQDRQMLFSIMDSGKSANADTHKDEETHKARASTAKTTKTVTPYVPPMVQYPSQYYAREYTDNREALSTRDTNQLKTSMEEKDDDDESTTTIDELNIDDLLANLDDDNTFIGYNERK
ncbi:1380_t:CDS:2, partial [Acaulospora morrowiae]